MKQILTIALAGLLGSVFAAPGILAHDEEEETENQWVVPEKLADQETSVNDEESNDEELEELGIHLPGDEDNIRQREMERDSRNQERREQFPQAAEDVENDSILTGAEVEEENEGGG